MDVVGGIPDRVAAHELVFQRDRGREAVAERRRVGGEQRGGGNRRRHTTRVKATVAERTAEEVEVGLRLAEGESRELDESAFGVDLALRGFASRRLETSAAVGTERSVLRLGAHVDRRYPASPYVVLVRVDAVVTAASALIVLDRRAASLESVLGADPSANLDAGIGSGNVEEPGAVHATDLHVFDRFGLNGKIGSMRPADH